MKNSLVPAIFLMLITLVMLWLIMAKLLQVMTKAGWTESRRKTVFLTVLLLVLAWLTGLGLLSINGFFADFSQLPPRPALAILLPLPVVLILSFSKPVKELLQHTPPHWLIYPQSFRIFVELFLWLAFIRHMIPQQMTFEGRNFDVLTGLLALPVAYYCFVKKSWSKRMAIGWNVLGLLLLLNILIVAVLSMPTPLRRFMNEPGNTIVAEFPFIYLPGWLVVLAYSFHIFSLRQLLMKPKSIVSGR